jgi:hypothetical protein
MPEENKHAFVGFLWENDVATGQQLIFLAETRKEAVASCLYTERLTNGAAFVGPTGYVVHSGNRRIVFPRTRREDGNLPPA